MKHLVIFIWALVIYSNNAFAEKKEEQQEKELLTITLEELLNVSTNPEAPARLYLSENFPPSKYTINIALLVPLTYEKEKSLKIINSSRKIASEINNSGGISEKKLSVIVADDQFDASLSKLVEEAIHNYQIKAIIGPFTSAQSINIYNQQARAHSIPMLLPAANANKISAIDDKDLIFRLTATNKQISQSVHRYLESNQLKKVAVFYQRDVFGSELVTDIESLLNGTDSEHLYMYSMSSFVDYKKMELKDVIKSLSEQEYEAVYLPLNYELEKIVINQISKYWKGKFPIIILPNYSDNEVVNPPSDSATHLCVLSVVPYVSQESSLLSSKYNNNQAGKETGSTQVLIEDSIELLSLALKYQAKQSVALNTAIREVTLSRVSSFSENSNSSGIKEENKRFKGQSGMIYFDERGDNANVKIKLSDISEIFGAGCLIPSFPSN